MPAIDALFDRLLDAKGSDLHLAVGLPPMGRIRGQLMPLRDAVVTTQEMESLLFEIANDSLNPLPMRTVVAAAHRQAELHCQGAGEWFDMTWSESQAMVGRVIDVITGVVTGIATTSLLVGPLAS